jgi:hypothetical protein
MMTQVSRTTHLVKCSIAFQTRGIVCSKSNDRLEMEIEMGMEIGMEMGMEKGMGIEMACIASRLRVF